MNGKTGILLTLILLMVILLFTSGFSEGNKRLYRILDEKVIDIDGNEYRTVKIGSQIWMLENLRVTRYRDGTPIPNVHENDKWPEAKSGAYCMVDNDSVKYKQTYGILYNFHAVSNRKGLCPEGWRIPTESECMILINYLGGSKVAGGKIKDNSSNLWKSGNSIATNESGFRGFPAGGRGRLGEAGETGYYATWWSSTSYEELYAWHWGVFPDKPGIRSNPGHKASGFSVRCIKD